MVSYLKPATRMPAAASAMMSNLMFCPILAIEAFFEKRPERGEETFPVAFRYGNVAGFSSEALNEMPTMRLVWQSKPEVSHVEAELLFRSQPGHQVGQLLRRGDGMVFVRRVGYRMVACREIFEEGRLRADWEGEPAVATGLPNRSRCTGRSVPCGAESVPSSFVGALQGSRSFTALVKGVVRVPSISRRNIPEIQLLRHPATRRSRGLP